jgi:hypothetical protein
MSSMKIRLMVQAKQRERKEAGERREQAHAASQVIRKARGLLVRKQYRIDTAAAVRLQRCYRWRHMRLRREPTPVQYVRTPGHPPDIAYDHPARDAEAYVTVTVDRHGIPVQWLRFSNVSTRCIELMGERTFRDYGGSSGLADTKVSDLHLSWHLPEEIGALHALEVLIVCRTTQLTAIPTSIYRLEALTELRLSGNEIKVLPETIGLIPMLTHLALDDNSIEVIPNSIRSLKHLVNFCVSGNELTELPAAIGECTKLEQVQAHRNKIEFLPWSLGHLPRLRILGASHNELTALPDSLGELRALTDLDVSNNHIVRLEESFEGLVGLQTFNASNNALKELHENWLVHAKLSCLQLRSNNLKTLPATFMASMSIVHLDLSDNPISRFDFAFSDDKLMVPGSETTFKKNWQRQIQEQVLDRLYTDRRAAVTENKRSAK